MKKNGVLTSTAAAIMLIVCLAARVYQIVGCTDMTSGFLYHDNGFFGAWGYYALLVLAGALIVICVLIEERRSEQRPSACDIVDARAAVIGFGMLLTGVCAAYNGVLELNAFTPLAFAAGVDFVFGAAMVVAAFVTLYKKEFKPGLGFSYCAGAVYFMFRGVFVFLDHMAIVTVPEYLTECLSDILLSLFFMLLAKYLSGNEKKRTRGSVVCVGTAAGVLTLSEGFAIILAKLTAPAEIAARITDSRYAAEFFKQQQYGIKAYMMTFLPWVNIAAGLFALAAAVVIITAKVIPHRAEEKSEECGEPQDGNFSENAEQESDSTDIAPQENELQDGEAPQE